MVAANITAARRYIDLVTTDVNPTIAALARCLDELAITYYDTPPGMPDERADEPPRATVAYDGFGSLFPDLGYYGVADPAETAGDVLVGDAIDDIMDIARDLEEVLWRSEHIGSADADWHFRLLFEAHWGVHLRNLSRYLHSKQFD